MIEPHLGFSLCRHLLGSDVRNKIGDVIKSLLGRRFRCNGAAPFLSRVETGHSGTPFCVPPQYDTGKRPV